MLFSKQKFSGAPRYLYFFLVEKKNLANIEVPFSRIVIDKTWNYFSIWYVSIRVITGKDTDRYVES